MSTFSKTLVILAAMGLAVVPATDASATVEDHPSVKAHAASGAPLQTRGPAGRMVPSHRDGERHYTKSQKEFYWTDELKSWARPGFTVEIVVGLVQCDLTLIIVYPFIGSAVAVPVNYYGPVQRPAQTIIYRIQKKARGQPEDNSHNEFASLAGKIRISP